MIDQLTAEQLAAALDAGAPFTLVDTRPEDSYEAWHIHGAVNVPFGPGDDLTDDQIDRLRSEADGRPIVAICGKGLASTGFGFELDEHGFEDVPIETDSSELELVQLQRRAKGCLGYVVGSSETGEAAVVDATRHTDQFTVAAAEAGLTIEHVVDTHVHADHVSGGRELADALGVPYYLGRHADERDVAIDYEPVSAGDSIDLGGVDLTARHTPGHTTESTSYRVGEDALLTGDTLFVESVGRTELQFGEGGAETGARLLHDSLHDVVLDHPDDTRVLPGHVSVTTDGRYEVAAPGEPITARLGDLRTDLDLLGLDEAAFVDRLVAQSPEKPPNFERIIAINAGQESVDDAGERTELELGPNNCAA